jgi:hypothetical protein
MATPIKEMFTVLPTVSTAQLSDIICAVTGYVSPSNPGLSVQESLQQIYTLFQSNIILFNAGNPNGAVAGTTYQFCWDTTDSILWICTTSGTATTAVWTSITPQSSWTNVATSTKTLANDNNYITNNGASLVTYTLPTVSPQGSVIRVVGFSSGGWTINYSSGQSIIVGSLSTTVTSGSLSSTNQNDVVELVCTVANTTFTTIAGVGNYTIV